MASHASEPREILFSGLDQGSSSGQAFGPSHQNLSGVIRRGDVQEFDQRLSLVGVQLISWHRTPGRDHFRIDQLLVQPPDRVALRNAGKVRAVGPAAGATDTVTRNAVLLGEQLPSKLCLLYTSPS